MKDYRPSSFPQHGVPPRPPGFPVHGQAPRRSGMAVTSLVLGIITVPAIFVCVGMVTGVLGIIFGIIGLRAVATGEGRVKGRGMAWTGITLSLAAFVLYGWFINHSMKKASPYGSEASSRFFKVEERLSIDPEADGEMTADEKKVAKAFLLSFRILHSISVVREDGTSPAEDMTEFKKQTEVVCRINEHGCLILAKVPEYWRHEEDAKEEVARVAWTSAVEALKALETPLPEGVMLGVGLKGVSQYGAVMTGKPGAEKPDVQDTSRGRLHAFFQDDAGEP